MGTVMNSEHWQRLIDTVAHAESVIVAHGTPELPVDRAEGYRYLTRLLAAGLVTCVEHADPDYPEFGRMMDLDMKWGLDCPDCLYLYATIRGDAEYRVCGNVGSANHIDIQVNYGHFASGDISRWGTISSINGLDLETNADGSFELFLGGDERSSKWLALAPNAEFVQVRQYFNDWENECPADLYIERIGATYPAPRPTPEQIAARFERLRMWMERGGALWDRMSRGLLDMEPNSMVVHRPQDSDQRAGLGGQAYGMGNFACGPEEAVIVEFRPPDCRHWSVGLANFWWESLDFATRQTSLNGHQARLDPDGIFRAVIAHEDPGVANWLDASGHAQGTVAARFLLADIAPVPTLRRLPLADLASELLPDTPRVDASERQRILEQRYRAVLARYRR
jgi:hypothetical protein